MLFEMDKSQSKMGPQYQRNLPYLTEVQWDRSEAKKARFSLQAKKVSHLC